MHLPVKLKTYKLLLYSLQKKVLEYWKISFNVINMKNKRLIRKFPVPLNFREYGVTWVYRYFPFIFPLCNTYIFHYVWIVLFNLAANVYNMFHQGISHKLSRKKNETKNVKHFMEVNYNSFVHFPFSQKVAISNFRIFPSSLFLFLLYKVEILPWSTYTWRRVWCSSRTSRV